LQNVIRKALLQTRGYAIDSPDMQQILRETEHALSPDSNGRSSSTTSLEEIASTALRRAKTGEIEAAYPEMQEMMERTLFSEAVRLSEGNQAQAARWLGISRLTLRQKLQRFGIRP
jgi:DNA-binding NtrC family response regulator